jgi:YVTN family beta-propeller protein
VKGEKQNRDYRKPAGEALHRIFSTLLLFAGMVAVASLFAQAAFAQTNEMTVIAGFTGCTPIKGGLASCNAGNTGSSGSATSAKLTFPYGVAFAINGNVYIADGLNGAVRQVTPGGSISTFALVNGAGSGTVVNAVTTDSSGNVFFGDNQGTVYMNTTGALTSFFGQAIEALAPDNQGNLYILTTAADAGTPFFLYVYNLNSKTGAEIAATDGSTTGIGAKDSFFGLALDSSGNVYTIDPVYAGTSGGTGFPTILQFAVSSTGGGLPTVSSIYPAVQFTSLFPVYGQSLAIDPAGTFYINEGSAVLKYVPGTNFAPIVAGTGTGGYNSGENVGGEPLPSNSNELNQVGGIFVSPSGLLYIADTGNNLVRSVSNSTGCQECGPNTLALTDQLPVNSFGFDVNPVTQQLYVPLLAANTVDVYDAKSDVLIASIPVGKAPGKVAIDSVNNIIYVPNTGENTVSVIDGKTNTWNSTIAVGGPPLSVAVDPALNKAFVAIANGNSVGVINGPTGGGFATPGAAIPNVFIPSAIAVDTKNNLLYVRCFCSPSPLGEEGYSMDIIDATTDTVTSTQELFQGQDTNIATDSIAVDQSSGKVVIADSEFPSVHVWVPPTQNNIGYFESFNPNFYPEHVVVDSSNEVAYFTDGYGNSESLTLGTLEPLVLSRAANVETTCGAAANVIGLDPSTNQAYMTVCPETVADPKCTTATCGGLDLFDGPTGRLITQLPLGNPSGSFSNISGAFAIAVNPTTHTVYVENSLTGALDVINGPSVLGARPALAFSPSPIDFGPVAVGATASATLTVTNSGTGPTTLTPTILLATGSGTPQISPVTCPVPPATLAGGGAQCTYNVTFTPPAGTAETYSGSIIFADSALDTPQTVNFSGTIGLTTVSFTPPLVSFGPVPYEASTSIPVTMTNLGSTNLVVNSVALGVSGPTDYTKDFQQFSPCVGTAGIAPGASCAITVTYDPFFSPAGSTETVVLQVNDNAGTGQQVILVTGTSAAQTLGYVTFSSPSINFGNIAINEPSASQQISIDNTGGGPLTINSITSTNPGDFQILSSTCPISPATLAQFSSCALNVLFAPSSAPGTLENAQIVVSETNSSVSAQAISLSGTSSLPLGPPAVLPELVSSDNSVPAILATSGNGTIEPGPTASMSSGGQYVAFSYYAVNLPGPFQSPFGPLSGVYLRNTCLGASPACEQGTSFVAIGPASGPGNNGGAACSGGSQYPAIDTTGEFVAFESYTCQFSGITSTNESQIYLRDVIKGTSTMVSLDSTQNPVSQGAAFSPFSMSANAQYFAYETASPNVVAGVANAGATNEIYSANVCTGQAAGACTPSTLLVSQDPTNANVLANNTAEYPAISPDGRYVAFASKATNLVSGVTIPASSEQIFLRDTCVGAAAGCNPSTILISHGTTAGFVFSDTPPSVSSGGRYVAFVSSDSSLIPSGVIKPSFAEPQIYLYDTCVSAGVNVCGAATPTTTLISQFSGSAGNNSSSFPFISADGRLITFVSTSSNLNSSASSDVATYEFDTCIANNVPVPSCTSGLHLLSLGSSSFADGGGPAPVDATDQFVAFTVTNMSNSGYPSSEVYVGRSTVPAPSIPTATVLNLSPTPTVIYGQPVSLTATVTVAGSATPVSNGLVTFLDGNLTLGSAILGPAGVARFTTTSLLPGAQTISAIFSGAGSDGASSANGSLDVLTLFSIQVTPATQSVAVNGTQQFTVTGTYSNGSTSAIPGTITWSATSTPAGVASVNASGLATGLTGGTATITATQGAASGTATLTVTSSAPPSPVNITVNESITVTDTPVVSDVSDSEPITVTDTPLVVAMPATLPIAVPVAYFSAGSLGFGGIAAGQTATLPLTVSNIGQADLSLAVTSPGSPFSISQVACTNGASSLPTTLASMGACVLSITYLAPSGTPPNGTITFTDNSPLSNVTSASLGGSNYTQTIPLQGAGSSTTPPAPPSLTVTIPTINESITVTDTPTVQPSQLYTVGGTLSGLTAGSSVTLADNGTDTLVVSANGTFTFAKALPGGTAYNVTVSTQPAGQVCAVTGGTGAVAAANVTSVAVSCKAPTLQIVPAASNPVSIALATNGSGDYIVGFTVTNQGNVTANLVATSSAKLGTATALAAPAINSLTSLAPGASGTFTITFPATAGSAGAKVTFSASGTYSGSTLSGTWSFSTRTTFTLP